MPEPKPHRALVTAPFRGPGLDALRQIADVVLDPWIDHRPLRIYNAEELAARVAAEGADLLIVESDSVKGPVLDLPLVAIGSCRGDPTNVDIPGATAQGIPVLRAPGRNADAVAEMTVGLLFAVNRGIVRADIDVREGEVYRDGTIPYQRFRAWQLSGRTVGIVGLGAVGRAAAWRFEGLGMKVITYDPFAPDATHSLDDLLAEADVVSMHAAVTPETEGLIGAAQFARMKEGAIYVNSARAELHDTDALVLSLQSRPARRRGPRPLHGRAPRRRPPAVLDAERRAHAAHRRRDVRHRGEPLHPHRRRPARAARRRHPVEPGQPRGPGVSSDAAAPSAAEIKQQLLGTAQEMLPSGLVEGTAGNVAARLPDGNVVLTPSSARLPQDDARRPRRVRPRRQRGRGPPRADDARSSCTSRC